jgi:signal peptidase I
LERSNLRVLRDYGGTAAVAVGLALLIRAYVVEAYRIPSFAMSPTLTTGDTIFVEKWPFLFDQSRVPNLGDIIVYSEQADAGAFKLDFLRRVVGLPGNEVELKKGRVFLNKKELPTEPVSKNVFLEKLPNGKQYPITLGTSLIEDFGPAQVPPNTVFVVGDFRVRDLKKRKAFGLISTLAIKGKATWIWLSLEPHSDSENSSAWIPQFRFDRMFKKIQ